MMGCRDDDWVVIARMADEISPELFADVEEPENVSVSHDGKFVVYSLRTRYCRAKEHVVASLWIAQAGKPGSARQLTGGAFNDRLPTFSPDDKHIAFLSDRVEPGKASNIYLLPLNGGEAFRLTPQNDEKPITSYRWSPQGQTIAYLKSIENTDEKKQKIKDKDDCRVFGEDWDLDTIHLISILTKDVSILETGNSNVSLFDWNTHGDQIVFATTLTPEVNDIAFGRTDISVVNVDIQSVQLLCSLATAPSDLVWSTEAISWISGIDESTLVAAHGVFGIPVTGEKNVTHKSHGISDCAQGLSGCSGLAIVHVVEGLSDRLEVLESSAVLIQEDCRIFSWDIKFRNQKPTIAVIRGKTGVPSEVFSVVDGESCQLSNHGSDIAKLKIGSTLPITDTAADGLPIDGFYCIPRKLKAQFESKKPLPTLVYVHGGPYWRATDGFSVDFFSPSWFMAQGYLVLVANYRGGMGHGNKYAASIRDNASASYQDVVALVKKGVEDGHIEQDRTAIFGWSQGGYMSYLAVTKDSEFHFAAAIPGAGVSEWSSMAMTSDVPTYEGALSGNLPWAADPHFIGDRKSSPIYYMDNIRTPMLLLHGEDDARVPVSQAISFHRGMRARKLECEMVIYPREGHGNPPGFERTHYIDMLIRTKKFLKKHIG